MKQYLVLMLSLWCYSCSNAHIKKVNLRKTQQSEIAQPITELKQIGLNYLFSRNYPYSLKLTRKGIYLGDGDFIYQFDFNGQLLAKINLPNKLISYLDFNVFEQQNDTYFYVIWNGELSCFDTNMKIVYQVSGCGDIVRIDNNGVAYSNPQVYNKEKNQVVNKIKVIQRSGLSSEYPTNKDLACLNLEIIDSNIMLHASDGKFHILPTDPYRADQSIELKGLEERVWFLGKLDSYYIFRTFDFENKRDVIHFYDSGLNLFETQILDEPLKDVVKEQLEDEDFLMDNPSATIYAYTNNRIYYLRNTNKGTFISELKIP